MSFIFGGDTGITYEQLQQRRKMVDSLRNANSATPRNAGEGIQAIARALVARGVDRQNAERAAELKKQYSGLWDGLLGAMSGGYGGGSYSVAPQSTGERMGLDMGQSDEAFAAAQNPTETIGGVAYDMGREVGSPQDRMLLAKTLEAEAGGEGLEGMLAAGAVINNRVKAGGYGDGLQGVIMKPGQFSAWNSVTGYAGGRGGLNMDRIQPSQNALRAADMLLAGQYDDPTGGATHYYNPSVATPKWGMQAGGNWKRIGNHVFGFGDGNPGGGGGAPRGGVQTAQAGGIDPSVVHLAQMLSVPDEFMPPGQKAVAQALLGQKLAQSQPMTPLQQQQFQMNRMKMDQMQRPQRPEVETINGVAATWDEQQRRYVPVQGFEPPAKDQPSSVREYQFYEQQERAAGREPLSYADWSVIDEKAGNPAIEQAQNDARSTASDVVVNATLRAMSANDSRAVGGLLGSVAAMNPSSDNAELYRQVDALKSIASAEALNAMRRQSKTGGALGNVTEKELKLLSEQAGTLDPKSPNFKRDLQDYVQAMLRTIHGRDEGDRIFAESLGGEFGEEDPPASNQPVKVNSREEYQNLPSGTTFIAPDGTVRTKP